MTRDDILRMAKEAGIGDFEFMRKTVTNLSEVERFAALVSAAEREECAMIVLSRRIGYAVDDADLNSLASEIRARGQK